MKLCGTRVDLEICRGKTFEKALRLGSLPFTYKAIENLTSLVPVRLFVPGHGLPEGWPVVVSDVEGTIELNASNPNKLKDSDFHPALVIDADNIELNQVNGANYGDYEDGGFIQFYTPVNLAIFSSAAMQIRDAQTNVLLADLTTGNGKIVLDNVLKRIVLNIPDTETETYTWKKGIYDLELYTGVETVGTMSGNASTINEVTQ